MKPSQKARGSEKETEDRGKQLGFLSRMASKAEGRERERKRDGFLWRIRRRNINSKRSCWEESHETSEFKKKKKHRGKPRRMRSRSGPKRRDYEELIMKHRKSEKGGGVSAV